MKDTSSLMTEKDIQQLESFMDKSSGYFYKMLSYLYEFMETGIKEGRFTEDQIAEDLQVALWYAYACLNTDEYEYYYRASVWMPASEKNAMGCGTWYYRYSIALMYCGRLEEALEYAEAGAQEEPDYPWIWLQVAKLRSHFKDREGALAAARRGLDLEPGDYEFLTLIQEIENGYTLEQMEYHWIDPECDRLLQSGEDDERENKLRAISCIKINPEGINNFARLFRPKDTDWSDNGPYCCFNYSVLGHEMELVFRMNKAGLSKLDPVWLGIQKERLDDGRWLYHTLEEGRVGTLNTAVFGLDRSVSLIFELPETEEYFQVWLLEDGTPAEMYGRTNYQ